MSATRKAMLAVTGRREVSWAMLWLREFLNGRKIVSPRRFVRDQSPRDVPRPDLPSGPYDKLAANYYCSHDARREMQPSTLIFSQEQTAAAALQSGKSSDATQMTSKLANDKAPLPGQKYEHEEVVQVGKTEDYGMLELPAERPNVKW